MAVILRRATEGWEYSAIQSLITEMAAWDIEKCAEMGLETDFIIGAYYREKGDELPEKFGRPRSAMFLALDRQEVVGCLGYFPLSDQIAEICKFWIRAEARGLGLGLKLIDAVIAAVRKDGYRGIWLETAPFMQSALALYAKKGFKPMPAFRPEPQGLEGQSIFLGLDL